MNATLRILILSALVLASGPAHAAPGLILAPESRLWLDGKSTIHAYSSKATRLGAVLHHDAAAWPSGPMNGEALERLVRAKGVRSVEVVVPVAEMRSGKAGLDRNLQKSLLASKYPDIRFTMSSYALEEGSAPGEIVIQTEGALEVAGVERAVEVKITGTREAEALRLRASVPLLMSQFGIKPPTMMMGSLRTSDQVIVHFDLVLRAGDVAPANRE